MTETPEMSIYEKSFVKSDKTDAILVLDGKKLHVNKALLSYHSDYFNTLFNSVPREETDAIAILGVKLENFATVLSLVHDAPIKYTYYQAESLLEIADRFQLPAVKRHVELFVLTCNFNANDERVLKWADKFNLNDLLSRVLSYFGCETTFELSKKRGFLDKLSNETIAKLFERMLVVGGLLDKEALHLLQSRRPFVDVYGTAFVKSDKTDAILVVYGKKLHVNRAVLSYHSDYFSTLFNSEEKSMEEIPIEDVKFESFVTLVSFYHSNPIIPTKENAEDILELADRFLISSTKFYMEPYIIHFYFPPIDAIRLGEKFQMDSLYQSGFDQLNNYAFNNMYAQSSYQELSSGTKRKIFNLYLELCQKSNSYY